MDGQIPRKKETRVMPGNSGKGMDVAGRGIEKTNVPILPTLSHWSKHVHVLKSTWKTRAKGPESRWIAAAPGGSLEGRELQSIVKTSGEKGKAAQRKFNSSRTKSCLLNVTLC